MGTRNNLESFDFGPRQVFNPRRFALPDLGLRPEPTFRIERNARVFVMGSCFAARIRDALNAHGVAASDGGLDLKYNAFSMLQALAWATEGAVDGRLVVRTRDGWVNPHHHPAATVRSEAAAMRPLVLALERTQAELLHCDTVVFTLGLVEAWYDTLTDLWTNEAPPIARIADGAERFRFCRTGFAANALAVTELVRLVHRVNPAARFVGTVSPVPLKATFASDDVLLANTYSKSALRTVLDEAIQTLRGEGIVIDYFPSYELVSLAPRRDDVWRDTFPDGSPDGRHVTTRFVNEVIVPAFLDGWLAPAAPPEPRPASEVPTNKGSVRRPPRSPRDAGVARAEMRVVGVGLNKTGTKTLGIALGHLGLTRRLSFDAEAVRRWQQGDLAPLLAAVGRAEVAEDWPWPLLYREIDAAFPGTRFILTRRSDASRWYRSLCHHADRTGPTEFRAAIYGHTMPQGHEAEHIAYYERHNAEVRAWFRDRPDQLLEVAWEDREGWDPLCAFLGRPTPTTPFPWANADPRRMAG